MLVAKILVGLFALLLPIGLYAALSSRGDARPSSLRSVVLTFVFGMIAFVPVELFERAITRMTGQREAGVAATDLGSLVYAFLVAAPLEEGLKVAAATPVWRLRVARHRPFDGIAYAAAAALGFATSQGALFLFERPFSLIDPARVVLAAIAAQSVATFWGWALGRQAPHYRLGGGVFNAAWAAAAFGNGLAHHLLFARGPNATLAVVPIVATGSVLGWYAAKDLLADSGETAKVEPRKPATSLPKPAFRALREATRLVERPISLAWIAAGTLVTTGVITAMLFGAVIIGRRMGIDFAAVDRDASQTDAVPPLLLLAGATLLAFPLSGWIVARASAAKSVIEPAVSSLFAIVGAIVLLGLAAPVAVVIALACAPLAFGLAYFGAWLGLSSHE